VLLTGHRAKPEEQTGRSRPALDAREHPGRPPRVVVGEGDVGRASPGHADIASGRATVGSQFDEVDPWVAFPDSGRRPVDRAVADHDHFRLVVRQRTL
jgi:hypothetical protein